MHDRVRVRHRSRAMQADNIKTRVESAYGFSAWKLEYHEPLSTFAFNFNLRQYTAGLNLNTSSAMCVDGAEVLIAVACDKHSLPEVGA